MIVAILRRVHPRDTSPPNLLESPLARPRGKRESMARHSASQSAPVSTKVQAKWLGGALSSPFCLTARTKRETTPTHRTTADERHHSRNESKRRTRSGKRIL